MSQAGRQAYCQCLGHLCGTFDQPDPILRTMVLQCAFQLWKEVREGEGGWVREGRRGWDGGMI